MTFKVEVVLREEEEDEEEDELSEVFIVRNVNQLTLSYS